MTICSSRTRKTESEISYRPRVKSPSSKEKVKFTNCSSSKKGRSSCGITSVTMKNNSQKKMIKKDRKKEMRNNLKEEIKEHSKKKNNKRKKSKA